MSRPSLDAGLRTEEDKLRYILDDLLYFFSGPYVMLSAYVDESGSHGKSPALCVAGLLFDRQGVDSLDRAWKQALDDARIGYFHATESSHLSGQFKGWRREDEDRLYRKLVGIIKKSACGGAGAFVTSVEGFNSYKKRKSWKYSQYTTCAYACIQMLLDTGKQMGGGVDFTIEAGHKHFGELVSFLRKLRRAGLPGTYGFRDKDIRPLQAADLWAYELWKRVHDQLVSPNRTIRGSLKVLIQDDSNMRTVFLNGVALSVLFRDVSRMLSQS